MEFGFRDCFDLLDFWFSTDKDVLVLTDKEFEERKTQPQAFQSQSQSKTQNQNQNQIPTPESDAIRTLKETIAKCERILDTCKNDSERRILLSTINTLRGKLTNLEDGGEEDDQADESPRTIQLREERRIKALKEIYLFYAKQHVRYGSHATFDSIKRDQQVINLGEFTFIVKDFQLLKNPADKLKITEIFKKCSQNSKELEFPDFIVQIYWSLFFIHL